MSIHERTFIAVKPDGIHRGLVGKIIQRFEERGFKLVGLKQLHASKSHLEEHYKDLKLQPFFGGLIEYMGSGPIVAMVWEGIFFYTFIFFYCKYSLKIKILLILLMTF